MLSDFRDKMDRALAIAGEAPSAGTPSLCLLYAARGGFRAVLPDGREHLVRGDRMLLLGGQVPYALSPLSDGATLKAVYLYPAPAGTAGMTLRALAECPGAIALLLCTQADAQPFSDSDALLLGAFACLPSLRALDSSMRKAFASHIAAQVLSLAAEAIREECRSQEGGNRHVRRAVSYFKSHYMGSIAAADIAAYAGVHPTHLHRLFRREMDKRVGEYVTWVRMEKAKRLLMASPLSITEIGASVGVPSQPYFSRAFRQSTGVTPQAYRLQYNATCDYAKARRMYFTAQTQEAFLRGFREVST